MKYPNSSQFYIEKHDYPFIVLFAYAVFTQSGKPRTILTNEKPILSEILFYSQSWY